MKKILFFLLPAMAALLLYSCDKNEPTQEVEIKSMAIAATKVTDGLLDRGLGYFHQGDVMYPGYIVELESATEPISANEAISWRIKDEGSTYACIISFGGKRATLEFFMNNLSNSTTITVDAISKGGVSSNPLTFTLSPRPVEVEKVILDATDIEMPVNSSKGVRLNFHCLPENALYDSDDVTWSATPGLKINPDYVQLDDDECFIEGGPVGTYTVTVDVKGVKADCKVKIVSEQEVYITGISLTCDGEHISQKSVEEGRKVKVVATPYPENANSDVFKWTIDNNSADIISIDGNTCTLLVRGPSGSKSELTVSTSDGSISSSLTIGSKDMLVPSGFLDLGFRDYHGYPTFYSTKYLGTSGVPSEYPGLYAWGDSQPYVEVDGTTGALIWKKGFTYQNYKWWNGVKPTTQNVSEYTTYSTALLPQDDPVACLWGKQCVTPNPDELQYLLYDCYKRRHSDGNFVYEHSKAGKTVTLILPTPAHYQDMQKTDWIYLPSSHFFFYEFTKNSWNATTWCIYPWEGFTFLPVWRGYYDPSDF